MGIIYLLEMKKWVFVTELIKVQIADDEVVVEELVSVEFC